MSLEQAETLDWVGPVLEASDGGRTIARVMMTLNERAVIEDRGSYLRVLVPARCVLTRSAVETALGRPFRLPMDLEQLMPSFKGLLLMNEDQAEWRSP